MTIALAQQNYHVGNLAHNANKIIQAIKKAKEGNVDMIVFSELCVSGYPPHDDFFTQHFFENLNIQIARITQETKGITAIIGAPRKDSNGKIYNSAFVISDEKKMAVIDKTLLPEYDVFNEQRYFTVAHHWASIKIKNKHFAITICEDIWFDEKKYSINPLEKIIAKNKIDGIINLSASPFHQGHFSERLEVIQSHAKRYQMPIYYVNTIGAQSDLIFDGNSLVVNTKGEITHLAKAFEEDFLIVESEAIANSITKKNIAPFPFNDDNILKALVLGIQDYCIKTNFKKVIIGASGGIDSAVVQALASIALGKENVVAMAMPSAFSSEHSISDAKILSENLGNQFYIIPIKNEYETFLNSLKPIFNDAPFSLAEENMQSRIRGNMLMTMANKYDYLLLNTSNKSELAMGYGTLYGDMAGALSVLGDVFKTEVYELAVEINKKYNNCIPENILTKAPSAELRPHQKDSDSLPEYNILDSILKALIYEQADIEKIKQTQVVDASTIDKTVRQFHLNEYKRFQFCPILRISKKAFGRGRKFEVVSKK